jgi:hypothetical protein
VNSANLQTSDRLQRVDSLLADCMPRTTMQIVQGANVCAVNSIIAELRANGRKINCHRHDGKFYYRRVA